MFESDPSAMSRELQKSPGQDFLSGLAGFPADSFERRFSINSALLGLGLKWGRNELTLLYEAAFCGELCRAAFNGLERGDGRIRPEDEARRSKLETDFMTARTILYASPGWQNLPIEEQASVEATFLTVLVADATMAW